MNFSFSDVKTSLDRPCLLEKHVLYTEVHQPTRFNMLESIEQEEEEDNETAFR